MRKPIGLTVPYREVGYKEPTGWKGLTVQEIAQFVKTLERGNFLAAIKSIEAKLKERNT